MDNDVPGRDAEKFAKAGPKPLEAVGDHNSPKDAMIFAPRPGLAKNDRECQTNSAQGNFDIP